MGPRSESRTRTPTSLPRARHAGRPAHPDHAPSSCQSCWDLGHPECLARGTGSSKLAVDDSIGEPPRQAAARPGQAAVAPRRPRAGHSGESRWCPAAAAKAAIAPIRVAGPPAPAFAAWEPATIVRPAAVPEPLPHHRAAVAAAAGRAEHCRAGAAPARKICCRSARARAAQARSLWRQSGPQNRSEQCVETSRAALIGESGS